MDRSPLEKYNDLIESADAQGLVVRREGLQEASLADLAQASGMAAEKSRVFNTEQSPTFR